MTFLSPGYLWVLPIALLPWIFHVWGRGHARPFPFSTVAWLREASHTWYSFDRLKRWVLLWTRTALLLALVLFFARPVSHPAVSLTSETSSDALILFDVSYSMGAVTAGRSAFEGARARIFDILERAAPDTRFGLIAFSDRVEAAIPWTNDRVLFRHHVSNLRPSFHPTHWSAAWMAVRERMKENHNVGIVYVLSDFADHGWEGSVPSSAPFPSLWVLCETEGPSSNAALEQLTATYEGSSQRWRGRMTTVSWGVLDRPERSWTLLLGGRRLAQGRVPVVGGTGESPFLSAPVTTQQLVVEARLDPDDLAVDDVSYHVFRRPALPSFLVVNGAPNLSPVSDETYYLQPILENWSQEGARFRTVSPRELDTLDLSPWTVVLLLNIGDLPPSTDQVVRRYVESGGRVWLTAGDRGAPKSGGTWLPGTLGDSVSGNDVLQAEGVASDSGVFKAGELPWGSVRVRRLWAVTPRPEARVLLRAVPSARPVLLTGTVGKGTVGKGTVALWTTSVDRDWTNFPATPLFPILCRTLLGENGGPSDEKTFFTVGEPLALQQLKDESAPVVVHRPDGIRETMSRSPKGLEYNRLDVPGIYEVETSRGERFPVAVNVDRSQGEGRLSRVSRERVSALLGDRVQWVAPGADLSRAMSGRPWAPGLAWAIFFLFVMETLLIFFRKRGA